VGRRSCLPVWRGEVEAPKVVPPSATPSRDRRAKREGRRPVPFHPIPPFHPFHPSLLSDISTSSRQGRNFRQHIFAPPVAAELPLVGKFVVVQFFFDPNHAKETADPGESLSLQLAGFKNCFVTRVSVDMNFIVTNFTVFRFRTAKCPATGHRSQTDSRLIGHNPRRAN